MFAELNLFSNKKSTIIDANQPTVGMNEANDADSTQIKISLNSSSTLVTLAANQRKTPPITISIKNNMIVNLNSSF